MAFWGLGISSLESQALWDQRIQAGSLHFSVDATEAADVNIPWRTASHSVLLRLTCATFILHGPGFRGEILQGGKANGAVPVHNSSAALFIHQTFTFLFDKKIEKDFPWLADQPATLASPGPCWSRR